MQRSAFVGTPLVETASDTHRLSPASGAPPLIADVRPHRL
jgi:hypothetical protein